MILALGQPLLVLAETAPASGTDLVVNPWAQLGATGGLIALLIVAIRVLYKAQADTIADLKAQRDKADGDLEELHREIRGQMIPALVEANRTMVRLVALLDDGRR